MSDVGLINALMSHFNSPEDVRHFMWSMDPEQMRRKSWRIKNFGPKRLARVLELREKQIYPDHFPQQWSPPWALRGRKTMTYGEWCERGAVLFGQNSSRWKFRCPGCGKVVDPVMYPREGDYMGPGGADGSICLDRALDTGTCRFSTEDSPGESVTVTLQGKVMFRTFPYHEEAG